jgi:hypothetical protein
VASADRLDAASPDPTPTPPSRLFQQTTAERNGVCCRGSIVCLNACNDSSPLLTLHSRPPADVRSQTAFLCSRHLVDCLPLCPAGRSARRWPPSSPPPTTRAWKHVHLILGICRVITDWCTGVRRRSDEAGINIFRRRSRERHRITDICNEDKTSLTRGGLSPFRGDNNRILVHMRPVAFLAPHRLCPR